MKKFIYLSIALLSVSVISCREQDDMAQILNEQTPTKVVATSSENSNSIEYTNFNAATSVDGDPARPPKD